MIEVRELTAPELTLAAAIDVAEEGDVILEQHGTDIGRRAEAWRRPSRPAAAWAEFEARWRVFTPRCGAAFGAFEDGQLVGIATLRCAVRPGVDQLEALFVDRAHRRSRVAAALAAELEERARAGGATTLYVSATPSESAVGFYLSRGFAPTADPLPELLALEPDDIHMTLRL